MKGKIRLLSRSMSVACCFSSLMLVSSNVQANYAPMIQNPRDGYLIHLSSNSSIATTPIKGTNGKNYYQIGSPIIINGSDSSISITGTVKCLGRVWGSSGNNGGGVSNAYHRLFIIAPTAGTFIGGKIGYRINSNVVMTVESNIANWVNTFAGTCSSGASSGIVPAYEFRTQFPFTLTFYINEQIIDGQLVIAAMDLGGYVRAFMNPSVAPLENSWPIDQTTVPMRLASSQLSVDSSCNTTTSNGQAGTVNLRHGQLNSLNYDSLITEKVAYTCKFATSTNVRLRLDYASDGDSQKRLPMVNSLDNTKKIYSELKMTDESTGQSGTDIKVSIEDLKTITISSHIQGSNAAAGDYRGSAWLIATFD